MVAVTKQVVLYLSQSGDVYYIQLAFYHLNNIVFQYTDQIIQQLDIMSLFEIFILKTKYLITSQQFDESAYGLYSLANLFSSMNIYEMAPSIKQLHQKLIVELYEFIQIVVAQCQDRVQFVNGILWYLRNLGHLDSNFERYGQYTLKILDLLHADVDKYQDVEDLGNQISEDYLMCLKCLTKEADDDQINYLFESHIAIVIQLITNKWNPLQLLNLSLVFKNILSGQDVVIEQLLQLGAMDVLNTLLNSKEEATIAETIGCLANIFCAEDEEIIEKALFDIQRPFLIQELLLYTTAQYQTFTREESLRALSSLIKNKRSSAEELFKFDGVKFLLEGLS